MSDTAIHKGEVLRKLQESPELFILYSGATRCPYVVCDPETFDDSVFMYFTENEAKQAVGILGTDKIPVRVVKMVNKHFLLFYTSLYTMGINALAVMADGKRFLFQLSDVVKRGRPEEQDGKTWIENPEFHLTALYLMQKIRGQQVKPAAGEVRSLLDEAVADLSKGRFIQPVNKEQKAVPLLKLPNGEKYQPIFTDIFEFQKFNRGDKFQALVIDGAKISRLLVKEAAGVVVNPLGVNLPLKITRQPADGGEKPQGPGLHIVK